MNPTAAVLCLCVALAPSPARAEGDLTAAARAFDAAQAATLADDHARAAELYELADSIVPSAEALRSAAKEREQAGHLATAATLASRLLARDPTDERSASTAREMLRRLGPRLVLARVRCRPDCALAADRRAMTLELRAEQIVYLLPGAHLLEASFGDGRIARHGVTAESGKAGTTIDIEMTAPAAPAPARRPAPSAPAAYRHPIAPASSPAGHTRWGTIALVGGSIATVGLAAATTWSGLDTLAARDDFLASPTDDAFRAGERKQLRTNLLIGATALAAVGTAVATLLLRGEPAEPSAVALKVDGTSAVLGLGGEF